MGGPSFSDEPSAAQEALERLQASYRAPRSSGPRRDCTSAKPAYGSGRGATEVELEYDAACDTLRGDIAKLNKALTVLQSKRGMQASWREVDLMYKAAEYVEDAVKTITV